MDNREVAKQFELLADLLEFKGENAFKVRSYRKVARIIDDLTDDVADISAAGRLRELPGVGEATAKKIKEYIETGRITRLEEAKAGVPDGILDVLEIQGVGPKRAAILYERIGIDSVGALNKKLRGIRVLCGTEVDIKSGGSLDLPDKLLAELDVVIASIHSGFRQPREKIMSRITAAMENPHVDIIGHPTGRLIGKREPYDVDVPELVRAAAATGTALEINAHPQRLDLNDTHCRTAKEHGVKLAIGTDAHNAADLDMMQFGVSVARRGWLSPEDVLNTKA